MKPVSNPRGDLLSNHSEQWTKAPKIAFDSWLAQESIFINKSQAFRHTSQTVYSSMWHHFVDLVISDKKHLQNITPADLQKFLKKLDARLEHRTRYQLLLTRVFDYLRELGLRQDNPAGTLVTDDFKTKRNGAMPFLTPAQRADLFDHLAKVPCTSDSRADQQSRALTALLLGSGLKVGEALRCTVNCIDIEGGWVNLSARVAIRPHRTLLLPEARAIVAGWLKHRARPRDLLFPAQLVRSSVASLDPASVFRGVVRTCRAVPSLSRARQRISPQTLRNSYLASLVDRGQPADLIAEYVGFSKRSSALRAMQAYADWRKRHLD